MEEYLIFFAIGGLIFLTLMVNSVSEAYEQKQREKRIKILKIKQGLEEISHLLERLKVVDIGNNIRELLLNEIMARLQAIQRLDRNFRGVQALIDEASEEAEKPPTPEPGGYTIKDDAQFKRTMILFRQLLKWLNSTQWFSKVKPAQLNRCSQDVKLLRCEKIFQFYTDKALQETEEKNYLVAKEHYHYILHALKQSGISSNNRVMELSEQAEFMIEQIGETIATKVKNIVNDENGEEQTATDVQEEQAEPENGQASKNASQESPTSPQEQASAKEKDA